MRKLALIFLMLIGLVACPFRCQLKLVTGDQDQIASCGSGCCSFSSFSQTQAAQTEPSPLEPGPLEPGPLETPSRGLPDDCGCRDCICCGAIVATDSKTTCSLAVENDWAYPIDFSCFRAADRELKFSFAVSSFPDLGEGLPHWGRQLRIALASWLI